MESHDKIATRLAQILYRFNTGARFSIEELVEEFAVSKRTMQRDLHERLSFLPIVKENGHYFLEPYYLGKISFDDMKNFALLCGVKELYPSLDNDFITDLLNEKVNRAFLVNGHNYEDLSRKTDEFGALGLAILKHQKITLTYSKKARMIHPYKLINTDGIWYLLGDEGGTLKTYSFTKISDLVVLDEKFVPQKEFTEKSQSNDAKWFSPHEVEVVLEIDTEVADYFLRRKLLPNQQIVEQTDAILVLSTRVSYQEDLLRTVRYWIPHIRVRSPEYLAEKLRSGLREYLRPNP